MSDPNASTPTATATDAPSAATSTAAATTTSVTVVQVILGSLDSPSFIIPILVASLTFIALVVFAVMYNCMNKSKVRRRYVTYHKASEKEWVPEIHVPAQFAKERAQEAAVYRFG